jgi:peptidase M15-like protein
MMNSLYFLRGMAVLLVGLFLCPVVWADREFDPGKLGFSVTVNQRPVSHHTMIASVMPGQSMAIELKGNSLRNAFSVGGDGGRIKPSGMQGWSWKAPTTPGLYPLVITRKETGETLTLQVFVLVPATDVRDGRLNGYRIGQYPAKPYRGLAAYQAPKGFIEVTADNVNTPVSPHFRLSQFLSKQSSGYPKYLVLSPRLLTKLELLLEDVNATGIRRTDSLVIMSGFRTPFYNRLIGSSVNSRHMFGGAADIYIDEGAPAGMMDDLNNDGLSNRKDAAILYDLTHSLATRHRRPDLIGGLGEYDARLPVRGPFIHVDVRGQRARWGRPAD